MAILAGIDEAGFGPIMGPLVVSLSAFEVSEDLLGASLWKALAPTVTRKPGKRAGSFAVADSKKLYHRDQPNALEHLERAVLALLATRRRRPGTLSDLLGVVSPDSPKLFGGYPWYDGADLPLPRSVSAEHVALLSNAAAAAMIRAGVQLAAMRSEVVFAGEFNRLCEATRNKSTVLFDVTSRLIAYLWQRFPDQTVRLYADRQGGRMRHVAPLQRLLPGVELAVLEESETLSSYRINDGRRTFEIHFGVKFDGVHLAVSLASMISKYLRELFMELENAFWARHVPGVAPTAGYYGDGTRFLGDIAAAVESLQIPAEILRRFR